MNADEEMPLEETPEGSLEMAPEDLTTAIRCFAPPLEKSAAGVLRYPGAVIQPPAARSSTL